jgi:hypothetical protein
MGGAHVKTAERFRYGIEVLLAGKSESTAVMGIWSLS